MSLSENQEHVQLLALSLAFFQTGSLSGWNAFGFITPVVVSLSS